MLWSWGRVAYVACLLVAACSGGTVDTRSSADGTAPRGDADQTLGDETVAGDAALGDAPAGDSAPGGDASSGDSAPSGDSAAGDSASGDDAATGDAEPAGDHAVPSGDEAPPQATHLVVTTSPDRMIAGEPTTVRLEVRSDDEVVVSSDFQTTILFSLDGGASVEDVSIGTGDGAYGEAAGTESIIVAAGIAEIIVADPVAETFTLTVTNSDGLGNPSPLSIVVDPAVATQIDVVVPPTDIYAGDTTTLTVEVQDEYGNRVTGDDATLVTFYPSLSATIVDVSVGTGDGVYGGLGDDESVMVAAGRAEVILTDLVAESCAIAFRNESGLTDPSDAIINVLPGTATRVSVIDTPSDFGLGATTALTLNLNDVYGNLVTTDGVTAIEVAPSAPGVIEDVTVGSGDGSYGAVATAESITNQGGAVQVVVGADATGEFALTISESGSGLDVPDPIVVSCVGIPTDVAVSQAGADFAIGESTVVVVEVRDASGTRVTTDNSTQITFSPTGAGTITAVDTGVGDGAYGGVGAAETVTVVDGVAGVRVTNLVAETFAIAFSNDSGLADPGNDTITVTEGATLVQARYRFFANADALGPGAPMAGEDRRIGGVAPGDVLRLRMAISVGVTALPASTASLKLQYGTPGAGHLAASCAEVTEWIDVGAFGASTELWRAHDNAAVADGDVLGDLVLIGSDVTGSYEEDGTGATNGTTVEAGQSFEIDWVIAENGAPGGTYYCFRATSVDGTPLFAYTKYPRLATSSNSSAFAQHQFAHVTMDETFLLAAEDTTLTDVVSGDTTHLRLMFKDSGNTLSAAQVRLKYYTSYADLSVDANGRYVRAAGTAGVDDAWEYWDGCTGQQWCQHGNRVTTVTTSDHGPMRGFSFELDTVQGDPFMFDWTASGSSSGPESNFNLRYVGSTPLTSYWFRVELDGEVIALSSMHYGSNKPAMVETSSSSASFAPFVQTSYRFYQNQDSYDPTVPLAGEAMTIGGISPTDALRVRVAVESIATVAAESTAFALQFAAAGGGHLAQSCAGASGWTDVGAIGSQTVWRGVDNGKSNDGSPISSLLLVGSDVTGTYEEANPSAPNPLALAAGDELELDWVVQNNGAMPGAYYCFRVVLADGAELEGYAAYPRLATTNEASVHEQHQWSTVDDYESVVSAEEQTRTGVVTGDIVHLRLMFKDSGFDISAGQLRLKYYTSYADLDADTNGRYVINPWEAVSKSDDWQFADTCVVSQWCDHGHRVGTVTTTDHNPVPGFSFEQDAMAGSEYLFDWSSLGSGTGPENDFHLRYVGDSSGVEYFFRIELDGALMPPASMHYGASKPAMIRVQ